MKHMQEMNPKNIKRINIEKMKMFIFYDLLISIGWLNSIREKGKILESLVWQVETKRRNSYVQNLTKLLTYVAGQNGRVLLVKRW
jgi:hypothetical protein